MYSSIYCYFLFPSKNGMVTTSPVSRPSPLNMSLDGYRLFCKQNLDMWTPGLGDSISEAWPREFLQDHWKRAIMGAEGKEFGGLDFRRLCMSKGGP